MRLLAVLILSIFLSSCGYKWGAAENLPFRSKIYVPFVEGDFYGMMTASLVQEIARSGSFIYSSYDADYDLIVTLSEVVEENIGFRYQPDRRHQEVHLLVPSEGRLTVEATVKIICRESGEPIAEPLILVEFVDFDHDYYSSHNNTNILSLGQLTEIDEAEDVAMRHLYRRLAKRIVDDLEAF